MAVLLPTRLDKTLNNSCPLLVFSFLLLWGRGTMNVTQNHTCVESSLKIDLIIDYKSYIHVHIRILSLKAPYENPGIKQELQRQKRTPLSDVLPTPIILFLLNWLNRASYMLGSVSPLSHTCRTALLHLHGRGPVRFIVNDQSSYKNHPCPRVDCFWQA